MRRFFRTYEQAIEFLFDRINYERLSEHAYSAGDLKLERMRSLLTLLGDPQDRLKVVHVAGTKGKGSTSAMAAAMLSAAGHKTGLFTSPHLSVFEERMTVDGTPPSPEHLVDLVNRLAAPVEELDCLWGRSGPTYFELATALAWLYFLDCGVKIAVLEVGLGGRLDATNVCHPVVTVITNISRDHTNILGSSTVQIAGEKAGIVKPGIPLISGVAPGPADDVVESVCRREASPLFRLGREVGWTRSRCAPHAADGHAIGIPAPTAVDVETPWGDWQGIPLPLRGEHQCANAALAVAAVAFLSQRGYPMDLEAIQAGMSSVRWPVRIEVIAERPTVIVDAAHNWASADALVRTLDAEFSARRRILVLAATRDKDVAGILRLVLPQFDSVILTQYQSNPRGVPVHELAALAFAVAESPLHVAADAASAWRLARHIAAPDDVICVTGSFFIAAELREVILDGRCAPATAASIRRDELSKTDLRAALLEEAQHDGTNATDARARQ